MLGTFFFLIALAGAYSASLPAKALVPMLDGRIVGGEPVSIKDYPHQIALLNYGSLRCGGSIISKSYAITAAHCTSGTNAQSLSARVGSDNHNNNGEVVDIATFHQHPEYDASTIDYDISVLKLAIDLVFSESIQAVGLPALNQQIEEGSEAIVTGWGATREGGSLPKQLQKVSVLVVSNKNCEEKYAGYTITERMLCAGVNGGGKDACQGDSGGPLVVNGELCGVVSWGYGCARPNYPGVYASVPNLRKFVNEVSGI